MARWPRYRLRCTTSDCDFAATIAGPGTDVRSDLIWIVFRAHADQKHRGVRRPNAMVANVDDAGDYAELVL